MNFDTVKITSFKCVQKLDNTTFMIRTNYHFLVIALTQMSLLSIHKEFKGVFLIKAHKSVISHLIFNDISFEIYCFSPHCS